MKNNRLLFTTLFIVSLPFLLSACSSLGNNTQTTISESINKLSFNASSAEQKVIIYNHGISRPQQREPCYLRYNKAPKSLLALTDSSTLIYNLCSTSTESPAITSAGKQVYLRKVEINYAIDAFLDRGVKPKHLFLAGHSNGAWTSLMMMKDVNKRFNGVIAFAPAFAGKRSDAIIAPWWRKIIRPKQIRDMLTAPAMDALVFTYENDAYNRPQDLIFLRDNYPLRNNSGVDFVSYSCGLSNAHQTFRKDCRESETSRKMRVFIKNQIDSWKLNKL